MENLPLDSAYRRATDPDHVGDWGLEPQLLAWIVHVLELQLYQAADSKKRGSAPKPIPMPWEAKAAAARGAEMRRRLEAQRDRW